jgi:spore germination protein YaaH
MKEKLLALLVIFLFAGLVTIKVTVGKNNQPEKLNVPIADLQAFPVETQPVQLPKMTAYGYLIFRGDSSTASLKRNIALVDMVIADALHLDGDTVVVDNESKQKPIFDYIRSQKEPKKIIAMLNNYSAGKWQGDTAAQMMASPDSRTKIINETLEYLNKNQLNGVSIDFESLPDNAQGDLVTFTRELKQALAVQNLSVSVHVPATDQTWQYKELGEAADQVIIMSYDQHKTNTEAGPIASAAWFEDSLKEALKDIPASKLVVGMGSYAYDWTDGGAVQSLSYNMAMSEAKAHGAEVVMDPKAKNSHYQYTDSKGQNHTVWLLDKNDIAALSKIAAKYTVSGVAVYRFGSEDEGVWKVLR